MKKASTKWHAVTVVLHESSCAAAALCRNTRFLATEAPHLPLKECPHPAQCRCKYRHYEDRRNGARRSADIPGIQGSGKPENNRRTSTGRRATDKR